MDAIEPVTGQGAATRLGRLWEEDPEALYDEAPCGYLSALPDGTIVKVNRTFCRWTGRSREEVLGSRFQDALSVTSRVLFETHVAPMIRMQGFAHDVTLEVHRADGSTLSCLLDSIEVRSEGVPLLVRTTLFEATARRVHEREAVSARRAAEDQAARSEHLRQAVSALAGATSVPDVASAVVTGSVAVVPTAGAAVWLQAPGGATGDETLARVTGLAEDVQHALDDELHGTLALEVARGTHVVPVDDQLRDRRPRLAEALSTAGHPALVVVPVAAAGRHLGALLLAPAPPADELIDLGTPGDPPVPDEDLQVLDEVGREAGRALVRIEERRQLEGVASRSVYLARAAGLLTGAHHVDEVGQRLAELVVPFLVDACLLDVFTDRGVRRVTSRHRDGRRQLVLGDLRGWTPAAPDERRTQVATPVHDALLAALLPDQQALAAMRQLEPAGLVTVPLVAEDRSLGTLTFLVDRRRRRLSASDVELLEEIGQLVSLAVFAADHGGRAEGTEHTLQVLLTPPQVPEVPGLATAARYLPATQGIGVGGDFYDVLPGRDDVVLAIGDVVGHDVTAATTMGQVRSVYRALLTDDPSPRELVERLQVSWPALGMQRLATAAFARLEPASGQLRVSSAGHLPPLWLWQGEAVFLPVRPSRMLGAPPAAAYEWAGTLPPGGTVVFYTDGLVERRRSDLDEGLARLRASAIRSAASTPDELCDRLLADLVDRHRPDDVAVLALTRAG